MGEHTNSCSYFSCLQLLDWHLQLDSGLPHPLGEVGVYLHQAEKILREELVPQQAHDETTKAIHKKRLHDQVKHWSVFVCMNVKEVLRNRCMNENLLMCNNTSRTFTFIIT